MKAAVFHKPKDIQCETVDDPKIEEQTDVIVKVTSTAICGSDLHFYNGFIPQVKDLVMGHEFMGIVEETGSGVKNLKKGDRIVVPFPISCGSCWFCSQGYIEHCENSNPENYGPEGGVMEQKGAGIFGYGDVYGGYSGGQAEYVRVPYADFGPRIVPEGMTDEQVLFLTDIFPTGWSGMERAKMKGGETVAVFGCGPVGIMAQKAAWLHGAKRVIGVDVKQYRVDMAVRTANSEGINFEEVDAVEAIREMTDGRGADLVVDAVGMEATHTFLEAIAQTIHMERGYLTALKPCLSAVRRGGTVSILGVYGTPMDNFPISQIFDKSIDIVCGQAPVHLYIDKLIELVKDGKVVLDDIITHTLPLKDVDKGYDLFHSKEDGCVKVVLKP